MQKIFEDASCLAFESRVVVVVIDFLIRLEYKNKPIRATPTITATAMSCGVLWGSTFD